MKKVNIVRLTNNVLVSPYEEKIASLGNYIDITTYPKEQWSEYLNEANIVIGSGGTAIKGDDFNKYPNLKLIALFSVGYDSIDLEEAQKRKILVSNTPGVLNDDVADSAMLLLMSVLRQVVGMHKHVESLTWCKEKYPLTRKVSGINLGIVGLGNIGKAVAKRAQAFDMKIGYFATSKKDCDYQYFDNLVDLAKFANALVLCVPGNEKTYHIVNKNVLEALGSDGYLINVARGKVVDTEALIAALDNHTIAGCALDVFEGEPTTDTRLFNRNNVILTPHAGSATIDCRREMSRVVYENIVSYLEHKKIITNIKGYCNSY